MYCETWYFLCGNVVATNEKPTTMQEIESSMEDCKDIELIEFPNNIPSSEIVQRTSLVTVQLHGIDQEHIFEWKQKLINYIQSI